MSVYLGDHVKTTTFGYLGRVTAVHHWCPESDSWLRGQTGLGDDPLQYKGERWVSVLTHGGGSVAVPNLPEFVERINPFEFENPWAEMYFRNA